MKVEQKSPKKEFIPIVITLETEEEALAMWGRLNTAIDTIAKDYGSAYHPCIRKALYKVRYLWSEFSQIYQPPD